MGSTNIQMDHTIKGSSLKTKKEALDNTIGVMGVSTWATGWKEK